MVQKKLSEPITLNDVKVLIDGEIVGMVEKVSVNITRELEKLWEAGRKGKPVAIAQKKMDINGSFDRRFVDADLLKKLAPMDGDYPSFDLVGQTDVEPDRSFIVKGCVLKGFPIDMDLDSVSVQTLEFEALDFDWL